MPGEGLVGQAIPSNSIPDMGWASTEPAGCACGLCASRTSPVSENEVVLIEVDVASEFKMELATGEADIAAVMGFDDGLA